MTAVIQDMVVDFGRCIGCMACVAGCSECHTHRGTPMIHVDAVEPGYDPQTTPMICMHCVEPTCALSCPADAIKVDEHGIVHSSLKPRCIGCSNCELACPFGVPKIRVEISQMQKCDMCYDRTSAGKKPMCATVCPTGALFYGNIDELEAARPLNKVIHDWQFGKQRVETRVGVMVPHGVDVMEIDWEPGGGPIGFGGPAELAIRLREQAERRDPNQGPAWDQPPAKLTAESDRVDQDGEEVFFL